MTAQTSTRYYVSPAGVYYVGWDYDADENGVVTRGYQAATGNRPARLDLWDGDDEFQSGDSRGRDLALTQVPGLVRISVDDENNADDFWSAVQSDPNAPAELAGLPTVVTTERAAELRAYCETVPGFAGGPNYAPEAILFQSVE